jgi:hypothetical protein
MAGVGIIMNLLAAVVIAITAWFARGLILSVVS